MEKISLNSTLGPFSFKIFRELTSLDELSINGKTILDIGSGISEIGDNLAELNNEGDTFLLDPIYSINFEEISKQVKSFVDIRLRGYTGFDLKNIKRINIAGIGEKLPFKDKSVDFIFINFCFHLFENKKLFLQEVSRVLKRKGKIIILSYNRYNISNLVKYELIEDCKETNDGIVMFRIKKIGDDGFYKSWL